MKNTKFVSYIIVPQGTLVKAMQRGEWVLLDEINLASAEALDSLAGLLESPTGSVVLAERGWAFFSFLFSVSISSHKG